jgi:hypothetical protein
MSELSQERMEQIETETTARVSADLWELTRQRMQELEGDEWPDGVDEVHFGQRPDGRLVVVVGAAEYSFGRDDGTIIEATPGAIRVIGEEGVLEEYRRPPSSAAPELN